MKPAFSYPAIIIIFLVISSAGNTQNNPPANSPVPKDSLPAITADSLKKINTGPAVLTTATTDSLKTAKKKKHKKEQDVADNRYQPPALNEKPASYNNRKPTTQPAPTDSLGTGILRSILIDKKHN